MHQKRKGEVYFIRCAVTGLIKIGVSHSARQRLTYLQTSSPTALELIRCLCRVERELEQAFHVAFIADRVKGEWFRPSAALLAAIALPNKELIAFGRKHYPQVPEPPAIPAHWRGTHRATAAVLRDYKRLADGTWVRRKN